MSQETTARTQTALRWQPYPAYRPSGNEWLGEIPDHWEIRRAKSLFRVMNGSTPRSNIEQFWDGDIPWVTPEDLGNLTSDTIVQTARRITKAGYESCGTTLASAGSLVLSTRAPIGHLAISSTDFCTNQGCRSLVFRRKDYNRYYYYVLLTACPELESWGQGSTFKELSTEYLENILLPSPKEPEQRAIANFLDSETAKIDALIAKKERLIELLREKRAALISHAVTKGLDPTVPMKDSRVEWLREIPRHWEVKRLKYVAGLETGFAFKSEAFQETGVALVQMNNLRRGRLDFSDAVYISEEDALPGFALQEGDILLGMSGSIGATGSLGNFAVVRREDLPCQLNQRVGKFVPTDSISHWFLLYFIQSVSFTSPLIALATSTAQFNISPQDVANLQIAVPSLAEQRAVTESLNRETARIEALAGRVREAIDSLKEYRAALISAAVTGKIDVRNFL